MFTIRGIKFNTVTSVCIFSILFSIQSLGCWQGEFIKQSITTQGGDHVPILVTLLCDSRLIL